MNRDQAEAQARELNSWAKKAEREDFKCVDCNGRGRTYAPLHGDPVLGMVDAGPCLSCGGTGKEKR